MSSRRPNQSYTFVEALVVISIIVLLFALLTPVLQGAKWSVKKSRSMSNMRQIHLALMLYSQDYEGGGPGGLGIPPDAATLKIAQNLPQSLFETGGVPYIAPQ
jgi:type II secretory pathway pseudopilin PulG